MNSANSGHLNAQSFLQGFKFVSHQGKWQNWHQLHEWFAVWSSCQQGEFRSDLPLQAHS